ncbi:ABC transporter permease subunit [Gammaproteobacteria bacterium]|nr:ABC transporter permease subunit [Gammaproteobacteria bacterium]
MLSGEGADLPNREVNATEDSSVFLKENSGRLRRKLRHFTDRAAKICIAAGGLGVIAALLLIFFYLFYEVMPLFRSADVQNIAEYSFDQSTSSESLHLAIEEQNELGVRLGVSGDVLFFNIEDGSEVAAMQLNLPEGFNTSSFALESETSGVFAIGSDLGQAVVARYSFETSFSSEDNSRIITPVIDYPFGEIPFDLFDESSVVSLAIRSSTDRFLIAGTNEGGAIQMIRGNRQTNLFAAFSDEADADPFDVVSASVNLSAPGTANLFIDSDRRWLSLVSRNGLTRILDIREAFAGELSAFELETFITQNGAEILDIRYLLGAMSLLVVDSDGGISQWFLVRSGDGVTLEKVREFGRADASIVAVTAEQRRRNFITVDAYGALAIHNTTAYREVFKKSLVSNLSRNLAISPRGDSLIIESNDRYSVWQVDNEHPEVSWSALWDKVWYESYSEPDYIWQSSASTNEFEPKYSLMPLSFGTLKAAFYAMLLAAPLAISGAIFTGYFMAPPMRKQVKPLIELMQAIPTVVLGFLAGLWLAPFIEKNLLGIFSILVVLPFSILLASLCWSQLPARIRLGIPEGWEAAILIPVILFFGYFSFLIAAPLESLFFNGDLRTFITNDLGITYDQRNSLVVGFAMGFAVIPTIFTIAEDAIFTVPKQLSYGSLALGATPWQTLYRVILPTASPGIFSALMIGMGRAVGETMIVLMATGNTPIMDVNIFEGMRTLAANIAVEIPESEVDSTHYRILFLAALVLFMFTFVVNTAAEVVRERLRAKYGEI